MGYAEYNQETKIHRLLGALSTRQANHSLKVSNAVQQSTNGIYILSKNKITPSDHPCDCIICGNIAHSRLLQLETVTSVKLWFQGFWAWNEAKGFDISDKAPKHRQPQGTHFKRTGGLDQDRDPKSWGSSMKSVSVSRCPFCLFDTLYLGVCIFVCISVHVSVSLRSRRWGGKWHVERAWAPFPNLCKRPWLILSHSCCSHRQYVLNRTICKCSTRENENLNSYYTVKCISWVSLP